MYHISDGVELVADAGSESTGTLTAGKETATTTIYGEVGSFAESYAKENGIPFIAVTKSL